MADLQVACYKMSVTLIQAYLVAYYIIAGVQRIDAEFTEIVLYKDISTISRWHCQAFIVRRQLDIS